MVAGGHVWLHEGVHSCGGVCGWQGGAWLLGGVHGCRRGHAWFPGGVCGCGGVCMVAGGPAWLPVGGGMCGR